MSSSRRAPFSFEGNQSLGEDKAAAIWASLRTAIREIQLGNASQLRFEELYRNSYTLVLHKHGDMLYRGVADAVKEQLHGVAARVAEASAENLLEVLCEQWEHHKLVMSMIRDILMYLDKTHCKLQKKVPVFNMGLLLFRDDVVRAPAIRARLSAALLDVVRRERAGEVVDRVLMKNCLAMLVEVAVHSREVYREEFEDAFLEETRQFYRQEAQEFMAANACPEYLRKAEQRLAEEEARADSYLDKGTRKLLMRAANEELVARYAQALAEDDASGCARMFDQQETDNLRRMYHLFSRVPDTLEHVRRAMGARVRERGAAIVQGMEGGGGGSGGGGKSSAATTPKAFVQEVLDCREQFSRLVADAFGGDPLFVRALGDALVHFINLDARTARYLSTYVDDMMRQGLRGVPEDEVKERLASVISVFRYLQDKDVFEDFYKKHLAARLLSASSGSADVERLMISSLKAECGHQYTSRLEGMFRDMSRSREAAAGFAEFAAGLERPPEAELCPTVLTSGFWPVARAEQCALPAEAERCARLFGDYYENKHSGRRLAWQTALGSAELRCRFARGRKELVVSTYQMCVLMLYNERDSYTYQELQDLTRIPEPELRRHALSLAHPKVRVLRKTPNTKGVAADHTFAWNGDYASKMFRVKIPLLSAAAAGGPAGGGGAGGGGVGAGGGAGSDADVPHAVLESRRNRVSAVLVRVMKARKSLDHNNLVAEVVKQLRESFPVEPAFIKQRIENLIEREYLERDRENRRLYHYIA